MTTIHNPRIRYVFAAFLLAGFISVVLTSSVIAVPVPLNRGSLYLENIEASKDDYCVGDKVKIGGWVQDGGGFGVTKADILVHGVKKTESNYISRFEMEVPAEKEGDFDIPITAAKKGYDDSDAEMASYKIHACKYNLAIQYEETYTSYVGGWIYMTYARLTLHAVLTTTADNSLVALEGGATSNTLKGIYSMGGFVAIAPKGFKCQPSDSKTQGTMSITFSGRIEKEKAILHFDQVPIQVDILQTWSCNPLAPRSVTPDKFLSAANSPVDFFTKVKIKDVTLEPGSGEYDLGYEYGGVFWANIQMNSTGTISLSAKYR